MRLYSGVTMMERRHWPGARHARHDGDARTVAYGPHAAGRRRSADESRLLRQRQHVEAPAGIKEQVEAGACGPAAREDWGNTPAAIDNRLTVADRMDAGGDPYRHLERVGLRGDDAPPLWAAPSPLHIPKAGGGHALTSAWPARRTLPPDQPG